MMPPPPGRPSDIFSREKSFAHPWIGSPALNRAGLHPLRIGLANVFTRLRRLQVTKPDDGAAVRHLRRRGVVVLRDFLPTSRFESLREEVERRVEDREASAPLPTGGAEGFGDKLPFDGGFDRFDGSTLNRFLDIDAESTPECARMVEEPRLRQLCEWACTYRLKPKKLSIYVTVQGEDAPHDIQKDLHRDTFHSAIKLWYFLHPVTDDDGPFEYVVGSHRTDARRYRWEYRTSTSISSRDRESRNGSFRARPEDLRNMGLPSPSRFPVPANTLVLADVRGLHRRGVGRPGARRLSLYANLRPHPYSPIPR